MSFQSGLLPAEGVSVPSLARGGHQTLQQGGDLQKLQQQLGHYLVFYCLRFQLPPFYSMSSLRY